MTDVIVSEVLQKLSEKEELLQSIHVSKHLQPEVDLGNLLLNDLDEIDLGNIKWVNLFGSMFWMVATKLKISLTNVKLSLVHRVKN